MLRKISAVLIILAYSLNAFGESFADLLGANTSSQISVSQALEYEQPAQTFQIQNNHEQSSEHHSDCADSKNCHHCSSCYCGFALVDSNIQIDPILLDRKNTQYGDSYLSVSLTGLQRPPRV